MTKRGVFVQALSKYVDAETDVYSYDTGTNRLLEITGSNPMAFTYDENGNTVNMGNKGFAFNQNNRMIQASVDGAPAAGYTYNGFDQRIKKTAGDITTIYHYDQSGNLISESNESGENIIDYIYLGNTRIAAVLSPTGECQGDLDNDGDVDGSDLAVFAVDFGRTDCDTRSPSEDIFGDNNDVDWSDLAVFAGNFGGTDCRAESVYYYHNDHLGTPQKMTDVNGTVVWSADYRPFGQADVTVNTVANNFRFPGQYEDEETGLHYNWHRYYDPGIGKYLRADPSHSVQSGGMGVPYLIPFLLDKPQELNAYTYVQNDPVNMLDPTGLVCGSGWNEYIVPDRPSGFDFTAACRWHDDCYSRCGVNKKACDKRFYRLMLKECRSKYVGTKMQTCESMAASYYEVVSNLAQEAFDDAQSKCECNP